MSHSQLKAIISQSKRLQSKFTSPRLSAETPNRIGSLRTTFACTLNGRQKWCRLAAFLGTGSETLSVVVSCALILIATESFIRLCDAILHYASNFRNKSATTITKTTTFARSLACHEFSGIAASSIAISNGLIVALRIMFLQMNQWYET